MERSSWHLSSMAAVVALRSFGSRSSWGFRGPVNAYSQILCFNNGSISPSGVSVRQQPTSRYVTNLSSRGFASLISTLKERCLLHSTTTEDLPEPVQGSTTQAIAVYAGFDPTADALHVGNL